MTVVKTNFGFHSTTDEVISGIDLTGKRAIVTGGASGIGIGKGFSKGRSRSNNCCKKCECSKKDCR